MYGFPHGLKGGAKSDSPIPKHAFVLPPYFGREDEPRIDASRPAAEQMAGFAALGWGTPPRVGELMRRMVKYAEGEAAWYATVEGSAHNGKGAGDSDDEGGWPVDADDALHDLYGVAHAAELGEEDA